MENSLAASPSKGASSRRTMAILCKSACSVHRSAIQARIASSGFAILSERLESWSSESDADFLYDFLQGSGNEGEQHRACWTARLTDEPIYVMALERNRAAEMLQNLCGADAADGQAGTMGEDGEPVEKSGGLRAEFGEDAVIYASPPALAERQMAICFPELATSEALASLQLSTLNGPNTVTAVDSNGSFLVREDDDIVYDEQGRAFDAHNGEPLELHEEMVKSARSTIASNDDGARVFKARPLPGSHGRAAVSQPRLSRAAALRMGVAVPEPPKRSAGSTSSASRDPSVGISGLPKASVAVPKSLAAPTIAPRMNRTAAGRTMPGADAPVAQRERKAVDYSNTPGHKRTGGGPAGSSGGTALASLAAPSVAPRLNKAAAARAAAGASGGGSRVTASASFAARGTPAPRASSVASGVIDRGTLSTSPLAERKAVDFSSTPGHKRVSMSSNALKSLQAPTIAPRTNRTSLARLGGGGGGGVGGSAPSGEGAPAKAVAAIRPASSAALSRPRGKENGSSAASDRERRPVDFSNTPGHKRSAQSIASIASLAQPTIVPRTNVTSQRRLSMGSSSSGPTVKVAGVMPGRTAVRGRAPPSSFRV